MARTTTRWLAAPLMLLLATAISPARADTTVPTTPPVTTTTAATATTTTTTTTAPPPATTAAPPPVAAPAAVGTATAASAVPRVRPRLAHVPSRPVAHAAAAGAVTIRDFSFGPASVTVNAGEAVTWVNDGPTDHTATGSGFDTGTLHKGQSASHTFAAAGTFSYHCSLHPFMKGTVTVVAGSTAAAGAGATTSGGTSAAAATGPSLPSTGGDSLPIAALGAAIVLLGVGLRRRARAR